MTPQAPTIETIPVPYLRLFYECSRKHLTEVTAAEEQDWAPGSVLCLHHTSTTHYPGCAGPHACLGIATFKVIGDA